MFLLLAQLAAPAVETTTTGTFFSWLYGLLVTGLLALMGMAGVWLLARARVDRLSAFGLKLWENATAVVAHVEVHIRPEVKAALADGNLTAEERAKLKARALTLLKEALAEKGLAQLHSLLGLAGPAAEVYLSGLLERALGAQRAAGTLPPPGPAVMTLPGNIPTP